MNARWMLGTKYGCWSVGKPEQREVRSEVVSVMRLGSISVDANPIRWH